MTACIHLSDRKKIVEKGISFAIIKGDRQHYILNYLVAVAIIIIIIGIYLVL
jgi:hypothetical protein